MDPSAENPAPPPDPSEDSHAEDAFAEAAGSGGSCAPGAGDGASNRGTSPLPPPAGAGYDATRQAIGQPPGWSAPPPPRPANPPPPQPNPYASGSGYGYPYANPYGAGAAYATGAYPPPPATSAPTVAAGGGIFGESFFHHIDELRRRLWRCVIAVTIAACFVSFWLKELNFYVVKPMQSQVEELREPLFLNAVQEHGARDDALRQELTPQIDAATQRGDVDEADRLQALLKRKLATNQSNFNARQTSIYQMGQIRTNGPMGPFSYMVDLVLYTSLLLVAPYLMWEAWGFIAPALYRREKMAIAPIFLFGLALFLIGAVFGYMYVLPMSFNYLMDLSIWLDIEPWYDLSDYFSFCFTVTLSFGLAFELPLICIALGKLGLLSVHTLVKYWRWFLLGIFVVSAILTPPDVMSQFMMAGVLIVLYLVSIVGVWIVYPRDNG